MLRSVEGLQGAGKWHILKKMFPDFSGKNVLDLECGYGWHCLYAISKGAKHVIGIDISEKVIEKAKEISEGTPIEYKQLPIEDVSFGNESFDVVIGSLAFLYIEDLTAVFGKVNQYLKKNRRFVFSMEHPIFTSQGKQDWVKDENGNLLHWPVDHYVVEGKRNTAFLGHHVIKYRRTIQTIINSLIVSSFGILQITEPQPAKNS
jgi:SAM-dependent methyltransferase